MFSMAGMVPACTFLGEGSPATSLEVCYETVVFIHDLQPRASSSVAVSGGDIHTLNAIGTSSFDFDLHYLPLKKEDTILLSVHYNPEVNRILMYANIERAKWVLYEEAKKRGWTWLKIEVRIEEPKGAEEKELDEQMGGQGFF